MQIKHTITVARCNMRVDKGMQFPVFSHQPGTVHAYIAFVNFIVLIFFKQSGKNSYVVLSCNLYQPLNTSALRNNLRYLQHLYFGKMACKRVTSNRTFMEANSLRTFG